MKHLPMRFWVGVMIFFTTFSNYMLRSNLSVSIVRMVGSKNETYIPSCKKDDAEYLKTYNKTTTVDKNVFEWDELTQGYILSAYFWGYVVMSAPAGLLSEIIGPWHAILWSSVGGAIFTALAPLFAGWGPIPMVLNRFILGLLGGIGYPAINVLIAYWAPPNERGKFTAAMMGNTLGTVLTWLIVGVITDMVNWQWGFYVLVIGMGIYCIVFGIFVSDSPRTHRWISEEEKKYIVESQEGSVSVKKGLPPYWKILKSIPFWAVICAQFGNLWGLNLILTFAPKFMAQTMGFDIKSSAGLASAPYISRLVCSQIFGIVGDWMRRKEILSKTNLRKFFCIFSHLIPGIMLCLVPAAGCNALAVVPLLVLNQGFNGAVVVSNMVNCQDLSPNFAGTLFGITNLVGSTTGFVIPPLSGHFMETYNAEVEAGFYIFIIGGVVFFVSGVIFIIFGTGETQPWNEIKEETGEVEE